LLIIQKNTNYDQDLYVDGANGVGAIKLMELKKYLKNKCPLNIHVFNDSTSAEDAFKLNHMVFIKPVLT
jgi:hypothetical protein